jgi:hypothetical protein
VTQRNDGGRAMRANSRGNRTVLERAMTEHTREGLTTFVYAAVAILIVLAFLAVALGLVGGATLLALQAF